MLVPKHWREEKGCIQGLVWFAKAIRRGASSVNVCDGVELWEVEGRKGVGECAGPMDRV